MRQIVLDTETTGLEYQQGHRIIEIGCVELLDRKLTGKHYHQYIHPERDIDSGAQEVHGISLDDLADKPVFAAISQDFIDYVRGAELVIHNAPFDIGFINYELRLLGGEVQDITTICSVVDSLSMARELHPGQRNNLDALCGRYGIDNSQRELHGALLDSEILADVYISMTTGQTKLGLANEDSDDYDQEETIIRLKNDRPKLKVISPEAEELEEHEKWVSQSTEILGKNVWGS